MRPNPAFDWSDPGPYFLSFVAPPDGATGWLMRQPTMATPASPRAFAAAMMDAGDAVVRRDPATGEPVLVSVMPGVGLRGDPRDVVRGALVSGARLVATVALALVFVYVGLTFFRAGD